MSTATGIAYGAAGLLYGDMPPGVCLLAGGLCSVSGMLPDLDSDSGVPLRESLAFAAAVVPMLMVPRWRGLNFSAEAMILAGALVYLLVRFGLGWFLKKYTVHRGMFHSIPAAIIATEVAFLVYAPQDVSLRYFVSFAVAAGFMSHLILDEIWSVGVKRGQLALKKSFGTAVKFWGNSLYANFSCYGKLVLLSYLVLQDPVWMYNDRPPTESFRLIAEKLIDRVRGNSVELADEEMPPLREISREQFTETPREIVVEPPQPRSLSNSRSRYTPADDPFWQDREQEQQEYVAPPTPQPRYYNQPRYEPDRWIYQR